MDYPRLGLINIMKICIFAALCVFTVPVCVCVRAARVRSSNVKEPADCYQGSCWHLGPYYKFVPICVDGKCQCHAPNYNKITCLPSVDWCHIQKYDDDFSDVHAKPSSSQGSSALYSCIGKGGRHADVHVLGVDAVYGQRQTTPPTARAMNVTITSSPALRRPIILVLSNNEPVDWILNFQPDLDLWKVILISNHLDQSSVTTAYGVSQSLVVEKWPKSTPRGYGMDIGGGDTAEMLAILTEEFGGVASFAGTYRTESWELDLPRVCHQIRPTITAVTPHTTSSSPATSESPILPGDVEPIPCLDGECWHVGSSLRFNASCLNGHCKCNAPYYNNFSCLPSVGSCEIRSFDRHSEELHAKPSLFPFEPHTVYGCRGGRSIYADVHVLGVHEGHWKTEPPSTSRIIVNILSSPIAARPVILVLTNYEPVEWNLEFEPNFHIEKVILISHYPDLSGVTTVYSNSPSLTVEKRPSGTPGGYGTDREDGETGQMLVDLTNEFGTVASFAGTYKARYWFLNLTAFYESLPSTTEETLMTSNGDVTEATEYAWTEYAFRFEDNWNSCHGAQYVRRRPVSDDAVGQYIGAILCTNDRYKLVMADDLQDEFKNIADGIGAGEDHCEFVGAPSGGTVDLTNFYDSPLTTGYYRRNWGEDVIRGTIGGGLQESLTVLYYPMWYECGVSIP